MKNKSFKLLIFSFIIITLIGLFIINNETNFLLKLLKNNSLNEVEDIILTKNIKIYLVFMLSIFTIYAVYEISNRRKLRQIDLYINNIIKNKDTFDIRSYNEDDLSRLKNDIYKITVLLKEEKEVSIKEKKNLEIVLSDISHQLKTPLTSMYVINDLLLTDNLTKKERKEFLTKNRCQLERIEWLVTSLLKISRLDSGFIKLKKEKIKVKDLINKSLEPLLIPIELKGQTLILDIDNFNLNVDLNWLSEALINIIKNANEHTDIKGTIKIEAKDNPIYSEIIITDNGIGIDKKDISHIFERFYKVDSKSESIGIGLNMAKKIIELSGGEIVVNSKLGEYTSFNIKLYKNII